jgi:hypothetical protein
MSRGLRDRKGVGFGISLSFASTWWAFFVQFVQKIAIYSFLPPTKLDQVRTSEGISPERGSFSLIH